MPDQTTIRLFTEHLQVEDEREVPVEERGEVLRRRSVTLDQAEAARLSQVSSADVAPSISFTLFDDISVEGRITGIESAEQGSTIFTGIIEQRGQVPEGSFILIKQGDPASGGYVMVDIHSGMRQFEIRTVGSGSYEVLEIDAFAPKPCTVLRPKGEDPEAADNVPFVQATPLQVDTVSALILYTTKAVQAADNSEQKLRDLITMGIAKLNAALKDSKTECQVSAIPVYAPWWEEGDDTLSADISQMKNSPRIKQLREEHKGDVVALIREPDGIDLGVAWCMGESPTSFKGSAFCAVAFTHISRYAVLAHEIGHLLGCDHNYDSRQCAKVPYAYGQWFEGNSGAVWGTVMSYEGDRILHFSNPDVSHDGKPTGKAEERDNARRIRSTKATVSKYF